MDRPNPFCVVIADGDMCLYRHTSTSAAEFEAKRLAEANPGIGFFVLTGHQHVIVQSPVQITNFDDLPF